MDELDPVGVAGPFKTGLSIVRGVQRWIEGPDRASIYRDHYEEWIADLARRVAEHAARGVEIAERLDALKQDRERVLVLGNYGLEAWREAVDRRRAMLGDAAEATIFSELSAAELARVERTVRLLDPEDLDGLAALARLGNNSESRYDRLLEGHLGGAALVASGCVRLIATGVAYDLGASTGAEITPLGALVLRFMGRAHG